MPTDPRIDAYIQGRKSFARPILRHLRQLVHEAAPDIGETIKWGRPFFAVDDRPLCFIAAFTAHAAFGFWQGLGVTGREAEAAGSFGRLASLADLPPDDELRTMIAAAAKASGARPKRARAASRPLLPTPTDFEEALAVEPVAARYFASLTPGQRRDYIEWIEDAKRLETRARRIAGAIGKLAVCETPNALRQ